VNPGGDIDRLLKMQTVAVIGCSADPLKPSHRVAAHLIDAGYPVIPVHPGQGEVLGERCYPSLSAVPERVDVALVFRRSEHVPGIVREALAAGVKGLWLQKGIDHPDAAAAARRGGLTVVVDDCFMTQHLSRMGR
jgi:uncharacterized protein